MRRLLIVLAMYIDIYIWLMLILGWVSGGSRAPFDHANPPSRRIEGTVIVV